MAGSEPGRRRRPAALACLLLLCLAGATPAGAHRAASTAAGEATGIEIPGLTHGEMGGVAAHRSAIVALAARQYPTDPTFRRLLNHANIQFAACAWGLAPGAIRDEESPFNECSHAYLAAYRAVLLRMTGMPGQPEAATRLAERVDAAIRDDPEAELLCQYSVEPFHTGAVVTPAFADIVAYPPTLALAAALALALAALIAEMAYRRRAGR